MSGYVHNGAYTRTDNFSNAPDPIIPRFFTDEVQDEVATAEAGRAIYKTRELVELIVPGNNLNRHVAIVTNEHRERFAKYYEKFRQGLEQTAEGTPLEQWPVLTPAHVKELKYLGVTTVEQCSTLSDTAIARIGRGGHALRERARAYLDDAERLKVTEQLALQRDQLSAKAAMQDRQIEELKLLVDQLHRQVQARDAAPNQVQTYVPPQMPQMQEAAGGSSLDSLSAPRKRGRPSNAEIAAREKESV